MFETIGKPYTIVAIFRMFLISILASRPARLVRPVDNLWAVFRQDTCGGRCFRFQILLIQRLPLTRSKCPKIANCSESRGANLCPSDGSTQPGLQNLSEIQPAMIVYKSAADRG